MSSDDVICRRRPSIAAVRVSLQPGEPNCEGPGESLRYSTSIYQLYRIHSYRIHPCLMSACLLMLAGCFSKEKKSLCLMSAGAGCLVLQKKGPCALCLLLVLAGMAGSPKKNHVPYVFLKIGFWAASKTI